MNTETTKTTTTRKRTLMNKEFIKLQDENFIGFIVGNFTKKHSLGWELDFITMDMKREDGEMVTVVLDGGLRGALKLAGIIEGTVTKGEIEGTIESFDLSVLKPDTLIEIEHTGKIEVADGNANQYNVFELK